VLVEGAEPLQELVQQAGRALVDLAGGLDVVLALDDRDDLGGDAAVGLGRCSRTSARAISARDAGSCLSTAASASSSCSPECRSATSAPCARGISGNVIRFMVRLLCP